MKTNNHIPSGNPIRRPSRLRSSGTIMWGLAAAVCMLTGMPHAADAAADAPAAAAKPKHKAAAPDDFSGAWTHDPTAGVNPSRAKPSDKNFTLSDGTVIPLLPEAEKVYRARVAMGVTDHPYANTSSRCLPIGMPGDMMGAPYPVQIVQTPDFIAMLFEEGWQFRTIYMNAKHPDEVVPSFMGHSIGHWEGKTLVIDTVAMRDDTTLNFTGLPHSTEMRVVEHIKRTEPNVLTDTIEVTDPAMYSKPFTFTSIFNRTNEELIEYICEDGRVQVTSDGRQTYPDSPDNK